MSMVRQKQKGYCSGHFQHRTETVYQTTGREHGCRRVKERKEITTPMFYLKLSVTPQLQCKLKQLNTYP